MRHSLVPLLTAATIALGFAFAGSTAANAESVMNACASQWKPAEAAGKTGGQPAAVSVAVPHARERAAARSSGRSLPRRPAPAPAPATQSGSLFPWWQPVGAGFRAGVERRRPSAPRAGEYTTELAARARCPSDTVVWVNTPSRVYHYAGTHYYGHTKRGAYMCEADARAAGNRAARKELQTHSG